MSGLRHAGGVTIREIKKRISQLPVTVSHDVAQQVAPLLTSAVRASFDGGRTAYEDARPEGAHGPVDLVRSGAVRRALRFVANGTILRCSLGPRYARYLIGRFGILPGGDRARIPVKWSRGIADVVEKVVGGS